MKVVDLKKTPLIDAFLNAGKELGHPIVDINGRDQLGWYFSPFSAIADYDQPTHSYALCTGFSNAQGNIHEGIRWSTAHAYLRPAMQRANLDVAIQAPVNRVRLNYCISSQNPDL